ncbi:MAG: amidohydrolase family protein [Phenylobacterium sp.]|uniref:amidohydrolase family protein n=1 Tax=Phenylobacterium sp. TaxID=1871053 RepID=UPI00391CEC21
MNIVDVWAQIPTVRFAQVRWLETLRRWTGDLEERLLGGVDLTLEAMNEAGVSIALLSGWHGPQGDLISNAEVANAIDQAPTRFRGLATVDLFDPMGAVRTIRELASDPRFVGVRVVPWLWDLPPNDRRYYPVYVACIEAGLPFCTQIGHTGPLCRSEPGRPIPYLDDVLLDFPELTVVGGHVGYPWIDEVLSLARKYPNFYVDTSAYAVSRLPAALLEFMRGQGRTRVLFGTNWPMLSPSRCLDGFAGLGLDVEAADLFLNQNARRVFKLSV